MGIIDLNDGYILFTYDMHVEPTTKTFDIMAIKIQKWWKPIYYKILIEKALKKNTYKSKIPKKCCTTEIIKLDKK